MSRNAFSRRWMWLVLSVVVCVVAISALLAVHQREQKARAQEQVARLFASRMHQSIAELTPIGAQLMKRDPALLNELISRGIEASAAGVEAIRPIDPVRAREISDVFTRVSKIAGTGRLADQISALAGAARVEHLTLAIADHENERANAAGRQALYGSIGVLLLAVLSIGLLLRHERSLMLAAARFHAEQVQHLADHDALTGLPNRRRLEDVLDQLIDSGGENVEIAVCDLDGFKAINDRLGHDAGDSLLITAARDLQRAVGDAGTVFRTGGDEFCIVSAPGRRIGDAARAAFDRAGQVAIGSVGVATWPTDHELPHGTVRIADHRMYEVKRSADRTSRASDAPGLARVAA